MQICAPHGTLPITRMPLCRNGGSTSAGRLDLGLPGCRPAPLRSRVVGDTLLSWRQDLPPERGRKPTHMDACSDREALARQKNNSAVPVFLPVSALPRSLTRFPHGAGAPALGTSEEALNAALLLSDLQRTQHGRGP